MIRLYLLLTSMVLGVQAMAGGYEKAVMWSGKWSALAGAATGAVEGADALFFNPAGLGQGAGQEFSANLSPTFSRLKGPNIVDNPAQQTGELLISPAFGLLYKHGWLKQKFALGAGVYVSGISESEYRGVEFAANNKVEVKSELQLMELSLGGSWQFSKNIALGAAWRSVHARAEMKFTQQLPSELRNIHLQDLEGHALTGFRLGLQYRNDKQSFGAGFALRNGVELELEGQSSGTSSVGGGYLSPLRGGNITAKSHFPYQFSLGFFCKPYEGGTLFQETSFTNYSRNEKFEFKSDPNLPWQSPISPILQKWKDQWNIKLGHEHRGQNDIFWRLGYAYASPMVSEDYARATFSPPGPEHTLSFGAGKEMAGGKYVVDLAGEYSFASGKGKNSSQNATLGNYGLMTYTTYESTTYVLHTSFKYRF